MSGLYRQTVLPDGKNHGRYSLFFCASAGISLQECAKPCTINGSRLLQGRYNGLGGYS